MKLFKIVCRGSKLSLAQADIFKKKLMTSHADIAVEIVIKETEGDINHLQPLTELEGKDFFTKDIQQFLLSGQADFAVHSLKDVSGENFFKDNSFAIIERDDAHDVAFFNENIVHKLQQGETIRLGTSSPRRVEMAREFLLRAFPNVKGKNVTIDASMIRGNVDTRLRKLDEGQYDGIILACAGINRLLRSDSAKEEVSLILLKKKLMMLPLLECTPAPGQGAIVAETSPYNEDAIRILRSLNVEHLAKEVSMERKMAHKFGSGCHQKFGTVHINTGDFAFTFASGKDRNDKYFTEIQPMETSLKGIVTISDEVINRLLDIHNINLQLTSAWNEQISKLNHKIWVAKTETWFELAKRGVWVEGSFEGFGLKFIEETLTGPLIALGINKLN